MKMLKFMFYSGRKQATTKFSLFLDLVKVLRNSTLGEFIYIRQSKSGRWNNWDED